MARPRTFRCDGETIRSVPPYWLMAVLAQVETWLDVLLLGLFAPPAVVGLYGMARGLMGPVRLVEQAASHGFLPAATALIATGRRDAFVRLFVRARTLVFALQWPVLAVSVFTPGAAMRVLFGPAYGEAADVLRFLGIAGVVAALGAVAKDQTLLAAGRAREATVASAVSVLVTAGGLVLLCPIHGAVGAALAVLMGTLARAALLTWLVLLRHRLVPLRRHLDPLPLASLAMCAAWQPLAQAIGCGPVVLMGTVGGWACVGSALCAAALWRDHRRPGVLVPAGDSAAAGPAAPAHIDAGRAQLPPLEL